MNTEMEKLRINCEFYLARKSRLEWQILQIMALVVQIVHTNN